MKWWRLVLGLVAGCGVIGYMAYRTFFGGAFSVPGRIAPTVVILPPVRGSDDRALGEGLRLLLRQVDSLQADSSGRRVLDSLVRARPGLLDSARVAERLYSLQLLSK
jgi:hypothetical protein